MEARLTAVIVQLYESIYFGNYLVSVICNQKKKKKILNNKPLNSTLS